jgi:hypothetical protein
MTLTAATTDQTLHRTLPSTTFCAIRSDMVRSTSLLVCASVTLALLGGCSADVDSTNGNALGEFGFEANVMPLVTEACNCHQSSPFLMAPFSLKPGEAYMNLIGKTSAQVPTMQIVEPGALNASYLWHKVNGTHLEVGGIGVIMPPTVPLDAEERRVFERWIASGAGP